MTRSPGILVIVLFCALNIVLWFFGQTLAVFDYDMVAGWGLQESRALVDPAIVEVNRAMGLADTVIMLPLFVIAAVGLLRMRFYGAVAGWIVLGWNLYWPVVFWASLLFYKQAAIKHAPMTAFTLSITAFFWLVAAWGVWHLYKMRAKFA